MAFTGVLYIINTLNHLTNKKALNVKYRLVMLLIPLFPCLNNNLLQLQGFFYIKRGCSYLQPPLAMALYIFQY